MPSPDAILAAARTMFAAPTTTIRNDGCVVTDVAVISIDALFAEATRMMSMASMSAEDRRALRRARNDKRTRTWTRDDNKRVEAAWANRY